MTMTSNSEARKRVEEVEATRRARIEAIVAAQELRREAAHAALVDVSPGWTMSETDAVLWALEDRGYGVREVKA